MCIQVITTNEGSYLAIAMFGKNDKELMRKP